MSLKIDQEGTEIEVYTAEEVAAARAEVEGQYKPKLTAAEAETARLTGLLQTRAEEFKGFRKLSDEAVAKLDATQRQLYENQLELQASKEREAAAEKLRKESARDAAIRARVGTDEKLFGKVKDAYEIVNLADATPEELEKRVAAALGILGTTEPDVVAQINGFGGGSHQPPQQRRAGGGNNNEPGFGETDFGKAVAKDLGLTIEPPKTQ
jgi:hypothetical protein